MNENNLFDCFQISSKEFADEEWQKWDDDEFRSAFLDINEPLSSQTKKEDSLKFSCSIISLSTPSLTLLQISSSNRSIEKNTASVGALNLKDINTQSEEEFYDT